MDTVTAYARDALVVIPTLNEARYITQCIRSLARGNAALIVVVDGGSTDGTQELALALRSEIPDLKLITNPERLQSAGINLAVQSCAADEHRILVRCDAHATYPPDYVTRLCTVLRETGASSVVVPMDAEGETGFARAAAWVVNSALGSGGAAHRGGHRSGWVDHGHHAAFDLTWFRRIGGYDHRFSHNEDAEFDHRLWQAGGEIWLESTIRMRYVMRPTLSALARQYYAYGFARARMLTKHRLRGRMRQILPVLNLCGQILSLPAALFAPAWLLWPALYFGLCVLASAAAALRLRTISGLWAGVAMVTMHHCWAFGYISFRLRRQFSRTTQTPPIVYETER